ncbi:MAG: ATP-dependent zinc metalloprotease FtsH [Patescibacteria group bacterium]|nr:ATP-dependent zinc metalloprotease FtsH [Patescibacteria group bacterium]
MSEDKKTTNNTTKSIIYIVILVLLGLTIYSFLNPASSKQKEVTISEISQNVSSGNVEKITIEDNKIIAKLKNNGEILAYKEAGVGLNEYGITPDKVTIDIKDTQKNAIWGTVLSIVLPFLLIGVFLFLILRQAQAGNMKAMSFGKTTARLFGGKKRILFSDVAGLKESKEELKEVVEFLKTPAKFKKLGAEIPKGVLLIGPPGCGKTLLAKAVAGEANVPFFTISASEFVEMFVGVGASRVRDLFKNAKRNSPSLIFIDELDAVGRQRGTGLGGSHDEREQTLNQILVEMDGFETDEKVIVLAATNRPDVLDSALLRPGRFDRRVTVSLPDKKEREEILKIHSKNKPLAKEVSLNKIAATSSGFSGADLRNIVNEGAILAARGGQKEISQKNLEEAIEKVMLGPEKKSMVLSKKEKEISAYHESGHAIVGHLLPNCDPVHKISVVSRGMALGFTWSLPVEDKHLYSKSKFLDEIAQLLAGREAEKIIFGDITTGAENDLKKATKIARDMVTVYGMSDKIGPQTLGERDELVFLGRELGEHKNYSEKIAGEIDSEISSIIRNAEKKANSILSKHKTNLKKLADKLLKVEVVEGKELEKLMA